MELKEDVCFMSDGTNIEFTVSGKGDNILVLHRSNRDDEELENLIKMFRKYFTIYCPDRRGWHNSGAKGNTYSMEIECSDGIEIMKKYNIENIIGIEYGAVIAMHIALHHPVKKMILFEPFLTSIRDIHWLPKLNRQICKEKYFDSFITYIKGTDPTMKLVPGFLAKFFIKHSFISIDRYKQFTNQLIRYNDRELDKIFSEDIESKEWKKTKMYLKQIVPELYAAQESETELIRINQINTETLLICIHDSQQYVYDSVDQLTHQISNSIKITFDLSSQKGYDFLRSSIVNFLKSKGDEKNACSFNTQIQIPEGTCTD